LADLSFVVFAEQEEVGSELRRRLEATGHADALEQVSDPGALVETVRRQSPDGLFADLGPAPHLVLDLLESIPAPRPLLLVSGPQDDSQVILRALKQGAREFLSDGFKEGELRETIQRLLLERAPSARSKPAARLLVVMGAKGGVGATFIATQLAASLQDRGGRTVVVDLNYPLGDVAVQLDLQPRHTLANLALNGTAPDAVYLRSVLERHPSGVEVLAGPARMEDAELVKGIHVEQALGVLREMYDWVIVDASRSWNEPSVRALDLADQILVVTFLDVPTLNHAKQHLDLLERLEHPESKIRIVVNRHSKTDAVTERDFVEFVGREPDIGIPNHYATAASCMNQGRMVSEIAPRSALHKAFAELALSTERWCGIETGDEVQSLPGRLFHKVFRR
jgi:pilus assembly protein CpaE